MVEDKNDKNKWIKCISSSTSYLSEGLVSLTLFRMGGGGKKALTSFSPVTSTNVAVGP